MSRLGDTLSEMKTAGPRRGATLFIFVTIVLDMCAVGMAIPVMPRLVQTLSGGGAARAAELFGLLNMLWAAMQFLTSPLQGAISDRFGRRPVILLSNFGLGADYTLTALAPHLSWLFIGRILSGSAAGGIPAALAYLADTTPPEKRAASFGFLGAATGLGITAGMAFGGLAGSLNPRLPVLDRRLPVPAQRGLRLFCPARIPGQGSPHAFPLASGQSGGRLPSAADQSASARDGRGGLSGEPVPPRPCPTSSCCMSGIAITGTSGRSARC